MFSLNILVDVFPPFNDFSLSLFQMSSVCGVIVIVAGITLYFVRFPMMYQAPWKLYVAAFALPTCGIIIGYLLSKLLRMSNSYARTVAIETSVQNFPLCFGVMVLSFSGDALPKVLLAPLISVVAVIINSTAFVLLYMLVNKIRGQKEGRKNNNYELKYEEEKDVGVELIIKA